MPSHCFARFLGGLASGLLLGAPAAAQPAHGIAMYGDPALPQDFEHLPYANPDAPQGGRIVQAEVGGFDSLNPFIRQGRVPWQLRFLAVESLMGRSWDEPFTLYGLLAESVEMDDGGRWVEFHLRPEAEFSDGTPVTVEDVVWSFETLGTEGHPRYLNAWQNVDTITPVGPRGVRITFVEPNREMGLIMGLRPILSRDQWQDTDFQSSGLDAIPITSAPYVVSDFEAGRYVTLARNPDYWGRDLPFNAGQHNIDEIRMEFFADSTAMFEAFVAGEVSTLRETDATAWAQRYDFPRVRSGEVVLSEIPHGRPSGMTGFVMNTRRGIFADWRVRQAMIEAFPYGFIHEAVNGGIDPRIDSYFSNSILAMAPGATASGRVADLLAPFADALPPGALAGYALPEPGGGAAHRAGLRRALSVLQDAGFSVVDGVMTTPDGAPFTFEILLQQGSAETRAIIDIYVQTLANIGIAAEVSVVDSAQYRARTDAYDFDMTDYRRGLSLSPGNEQYLYWGCEGVEAEGSRNLMGMCEPAAEAMIDAMLGADSRDEFTAAVRALDRVLMAGRYVVPIWYQRISRIAHVSGLRYPATLPVYGDWIGFQPDVWWVAEE